MLKIPLRDVASMQCRQPSLEGTGEIPLRRLVKEALRMRPTGVTGWTIGPGTGSPDGQTAVVMLRGVAHLPITGPIFDALGASVTITVESRAQSLLQ